MKKKKLFLMLVVVSLMAGSAVANLIPDGDFEQATSIPLGGLTDVPTLNAAGETPWTRAGGWAWIGNEHINTWGAPGIGHGGSSQFGAVATSYLENKNTGNYWVEGETYYFSFWATATDDLVGGAAQWVTAYLQDGATNLISQTFNVTTLPVAQKGTYEQFTMSYLATAADAGKQIGVVLQGSLDVFVDYVYLGLTPPGPSGTLPYFDTHPQGQVIDDGANAVFTVSGVNIDEYQWYKSDYAEPNLLYDTLLTNAGKYSGTDSTSLTITGAGFADEAYYYCVGIQTYPVGDPNIVISNTAVLTVRQLLGWWEMEGDVTDSSGNGLNGTLVGYPVTVTGVEGDALDFDPNEYFTIPAFDKPDVFSIAAWVKAPDNGEPRRSIFTWSDRVWEGGSSNGAVVFGLRDGALGYQEWDGSSDSTNTTGSGLDDDQWHHVVVTYDNSQVELYVDGVLGNTFTSTVDHSAAAVIRIGGNTDRHPAETIDGALDEVKLYGHVIDKYAVADLMSQGNPGWYMCDVPPGTFDTDGDCVVGLSDLAAFALKWLECGRYPAAECSGI